MVLYGTDWMSHLNTRYEPYNEQYINHKHRVDYCINCVPLFDLFTIILLVPYHISYRYPALPISPKIENFGLEGILKCKIIDILLIICTMNYLFSLFTQCVESFLVLNSKYNEKIKKF